CSSFSSKWPKAWYKLRFYAMCIHLVCIFNNPPFASKPTFARIDFLRQGGRLLDKKGTHSVKTRAEIWTEFNVSAYQLTNESADKFNG
ncbi:MAG: hypothetical protein ACFNM7_08645, partial [Prevotella conceptionensis]